MSTPDNRSVNFFSLFRRGQHYSKTLAAGKTPCPGLCRKSRYQDDALCDPFYAADRRIYSLLAELPWAGQLGPAVATALFALSLPMQGLWWLGKRSVTPLPPAILNWFYEVRGKLQESGQVLAPVEGKPDYQALADTLKRAFKQLDKTFLDDL